MPPETPPTWDETVDESPTWESTTEKDIPNWESTSELPLEPIDLSPIKSPEFAPGVDAKYASSEDTLRTPFQEPIFTPEEARIGMAIPTLGMSEVGRAIANKLPGIPGKIARGLEKGTEETVSSFTSPESLALIPAFSLPGRLGSILSRGLALYMGGKTSIEQFKEFMEAIKGNDPERAAKAIPGLAIGGTMVKHGVLGTPKGAVAKPGIPETATPAEVTFDPIPIQPQELAVGNRVSVTDPSGAVKEGTVQFIPEKRLYPSVTIKMDDGSLSSVQVENVTRLPDVPEPTSEQTPVVLPIPNVHNQTATPLTKEEQDAIQKQEADALLRGVSQQPVQNEGQVPATQSSERIPSSGIPPEVPTETPEARQTRILLDRARYDELQTEIASIGDLDNPRFKAAWAESEAIKNRYGGMPPPESQPTPQAPPEGRLTATGSTPGEVEPLRAKNAQTETATPEAEKGEVKVMTPDRAEELEKSGASKEDIYSQTGLWKIPGGKWIRESPPVKVGNNIVANIWENDLHPNADPKKHSVFGYALDELIGKQHPLFTEHPELKSMRIFVDLHMRDSAGGGFGITMERDSKGFIHIRIPAKPVYDPITKTFSYKDITTKEHPEKPLGTGRYEIITKDASELLSQILQHEVEHAVQWKLKLPEGGSPLDYFFDKNIKFSEEDYGTKGKDYYKRLAGEALSRLTEKRQNMTPEQRIQEPPWITLNQMLSDEGILKPGQTLEDVLVIKVGGKVIPKPTAPVTEAVAKPEPKPSETSAAGKGKEAAVVSDSFTTPVTELVTEPFRDWRVQGTTIRHTKIGQKLTESEARQIMDGLESNGMKGRFVPSNGTVVLNSGLTSDLRSYESKAGAIAKRADKNLFQKQTQNQNKADREQIILNNLESNPATKWIEHVFGSDSMNDFNKLELAKYLTGESGKFSGQVNPKWIKGVDYLNARVGEKVSFDKIKSAYEKQLIQDADAQRTIDEANAQSTPAPDVAKEGDIGPGPGAMTYGELSPEEAFITSIKNEWTDADAERFGLEKVERGERRRWKDTVLPEAEAEVLDDPGAADKIIGKILDPTGESRGYQMSDTETAILLQRKADIINTFNREKALLDDARKSGDYQGEIDHMVKINDLSDQLQKLREASKKSGTPLGQALVARKMLMREDYSLATMTVRKMGALERPLTPEESTQIDALNKKISDLEQRLKDSETSKDDQFRETQTDTEFNDLVKDVKRQKTKDASEGIERDIPAEKKEIVSKMQQRVLEEGDNAVDLKSYIQRLARLMMEERFREREVLIDDLYTELERVIPNLTRVEVQDAFSNYGDYKPFTGDDIAKQLAQYRQETQKVRALMDMANKLAPKMTGKGRVEASDAYRRLQKEVNEAKKKGGYIITDPVKQLRGALDSIKTRLKNQIADLDYEIATRQKIVKTKQGVPYDTDADILRARRDELKKQRDEIFPKEPMSDEQRLKVAIAAAERSEGAWKERLEKAQKGIFESGRKPSNVPPSAELDAIRSRREAIKSEVETLKALENPKKTPEEIALQMWRTRTANRIAELQDKISKGEFSSKKREPFRPTDPEDLKTMAELKTVKNEYEIGLNKDRLANRTRGRMIWDGVKNALGTPRQLLSSWDVSAVLRQGGFIGFGHPLRAAKSLGPMLEAMASETGARYWEQQILNRPNAKSGLYDRAKLYIAPLEGIKPLRAEEVFIPSWAEKIPVLKHGVIGSQRAYVTFLNKLRADSFDAIVNGFSKKGVGLTDPELKAIGNYVNVATGRGNLGKLSAAAEGLSLAFFSPRLVASRFDLIVSPLTGFRQGGETSLRVRKQVAQEYARFAIGLGAVYGLGLLAGAEIETDPRSSDFGKLKFGNTRIDVLTGMGQNTVLLARELSGEKKTAKGKITPLRGKVPFGSPDAYEVGADWLRTKFSPVFGSTWTALSGRQPGGEKATPESIAQGLLVPLSWQDVLKVMEEMGTARGTAIEVLNLFGAGVQNYDEHRKQR